MKVKKILKNAPLGAFCNTFDLLSEIICIENQFLCSFYEWPLKTGFTVVIAKKPKWLSKLQLMPSNTVTSNS